MIAPRSFALESRSHPPFEVAWHRPYEAGDGARNAIALAADRQGNIFSCLAQPLIGRPPLARYLTLFPDRGPERQLSEIGLDAISRFVAEAASLVDRFGAPHDAAHFVSLDTLSNGDLLLGVAFSGLAHPAFVRYRTFDRRYEMIASPNDLTHLFGLGAAQPSTARARAIPDTDRIWLVLAPRAAATTKNHPLDRIHFALFERNDRGPWAAERLEPQWPDTPHDITPTAVLHGAPHAEHGWIFASPTALWCVEGPSGRVTRLADLAPTARGDNPTPIVTADGAIWLFATGPVERRSPRVAARDARCSEPRCGAQTPLIRRLTPGTTPLEAQPALDLHAALAAAGAPITCRAIAIRALAPDPFTGGLLAYDAHHRLLFSLVANRSTRS